jgi:hypothetical protein
MKLDTKLYSYVGTSTDFFGVSKLRFANEVEGRKAILAQDGHQNIVFIELPSPMTKQDAVQWLIDIKPPEINQEVIDQKINYINKIIKRESHLGKRGRPRLPRDSNGKIIRNHYDVHYTENPDEIS